MSNKALYGAEQEGMREALPRKNENLAVKLIKFNFK
jgi:hypothetical protein